MKLADGTVPGGMAGVLFANPVAGNQTLTMRIRTLMGGPNFPAG